jgi:CubicO group peptidase (beta-lactamase class C family)
VQRILLIYFFIAVSVSTYAQQLSKQDEQFVDSVMNANYKAGEPGAVLLIAKHGQPVFRKGYGLASMEFNVSNKPEYVFRINSMTKQFTAVCMLKLAQEGKLNLHDDITKYLPGYNTHGRHIAIENLLNHTSGITDNVKNLIAQAFMDQSKKDVMNLFVNDSLAFEPGTDWSYSSSPYVLAGLIIEKVSGISLDEYLQQNIFNPLAMSHTSVSNYDSIIMNAANGYEPAAEGKFKPARSLSWSWLYAAGDMLSTVDDLLKWDNALYTEKIIKKEWLEKAWKPFVLPNGQITNYGFGWASNSFRGLQYIAHGGHGNGFFSDAIRFPSQQLYIVILSNNTSVWINLIWPSIALRLVGQTITKPSFIRTDRKKLDEYEGVYAMHNAARNAAQQYQYITIKNDTLFSQYPRSIYNYRLLNVDKDLFVSENRDQYHQFVRNAKGNIVSVELYDEPPQLGPRQLNIKTTMPLPKEKQAVALGRNKLELLAGKYDFAGNIIPVTLEGNRIFIQPPGLETTEIFAENETNFFSKEITYTIEFIKANDKVVGMILDTGDKIEAKKIE